MPTRARKFLRQSMERFQKKSSKEISRRLELEIAQYEAEKNDFMNELARKAKLNKKGELVLFGTDADREHFRRLDQAQRKRRTTLERVRSTATLNEAHRLAIEVPSAQEKTAWWSNDYEDGMPDEAVTEWLSEGGELGVTKLIKEEKRKNIEWWIRIITPLVAAAISLLGLIVALVTVSKK